ncbi:hypothetical protein [Hahella ganghwensis]|uniref:hypothetical protein n=1 Tax=Hahella ganghwensis TaxID=286420 RepID=UPI00037F183D|nr:hypothetical protein [Hahella ganghwensis]
MSNKQSKIVLLAVGAALASLLFPILFCLWEFFNEPVLRPDGIIDDSAERAAVIVLTSMVIPLFFILFLYYWLLTFYSYRNKGRERHSIVKVIGITCLILSLIVGITTHNSGILKQLSAFLLTLLSTSVMAIPGGLVLMLGIKKEPTNDTT